MRNVNENDGSENYEREKTLRLVHVYRILENA
jgi:hypothetical protein